MSDPFDNPQDISTIGVTRTGNKNRLTTCHAVAPLKILNPRTSGAYSAVILSSYGGGMVEGDHIHLRTHCGPQATMYLSTQALTKIYKNPRGIPSTQMLSGSIDTDGCAVVLPDPVVPYAHSIFHQQQHWRLAPGACLVLADSHTAGRTACGEKFAYTSYASDITITSSGKPYLIERYHSKPAIVPPDQPGAFGEYDVVFNLFVAGTPNSPKFTRLVQTLQMALKSWIALPKTSGNTPVPPSPLLMSHAMAKPQIFVIRALSKGIDNLRPLYHILANAISHPSILGANPLARKY